MTPSIESLTTASLGLALDAATLRQQVIAANIANADVDGYATQGATFEAVLSGAFDAARPTLRAHVAPVLGADGQAQPVQLDSEMASLSVNQLQYQALVKGLNEHLSVLAIAVSDGQR